MGVLALPAFLLACAAPPSTQPMPEVPAAERATVTPPSGYELHETVLCGLEHRNGLNNLYLPPKPFTVSIRTFVSKTQCWELTAEGLLHTVPGDCSTPPPKVASCN